MLEGVHHVQSGDSVATSVILSSAHAHCIADNILQEHLEYTTDLPR